MLDLSCQPSKAWELCLLLSAKKAATMFKNPMPTNKSNNSLHQRSRTLYNLFYLQVNDVVEKAAELAAAKIEAFYLPTEQIKQG